MYQDHVFHLRRIGPLKCENLRCYFEKKILYYTDGSTNTHSQKQKLMAPAAPGSWPKNIKLAIRRHYRKKNLLPQDDKNNTSKQMDGATMEEL